MHAKQSDDRPAASRSAAVHKLKPTVYWGRDPGPEVALQIDTRSLTSAPAPQSLETVAHVSLYALEYLRGLGASPSRAAAASGVTDAPGLDVATASIARLGPAPA